MRHSIQSFREFKTRSVNNTTTRRSITCDICMCKECNKKSNKIKRNEVQILKILLNRVEVINNHSL